MKVRTFTLGSGADVVRFTVAANNTTNSDTITNFTVANDKLSFSKTIFTGLGDLASSGTFTSVGGSEVKVNDATVTTVYKGTYANLTTNLKGSSTSATKVVVAVATDAGDDGGIYAATLADGSATLAKVGTLTGVALDTLTIANFATIA